MKKLIIAFLSAGFIFLSCKMDNNTTARQSMADFSPAVTDQEGLVLPNDSGIVKINLTEGKGNILTRKERDQTIYVEFMSDGYKNIFARLSSPDSLANIRFSQIFMPDGTMDGPFGINMEYQLPMNGRYRISIHENMMAGDPWSGVFDVNIELTE